MVEVLLPFGLPPDELSRDLLAALRTPALAQLLARASEQPATRHDGFAARLPHEAWIEQQLGPLATLPPATLATPAALDRQSPARQGTGAYFALFPVHLHIARDHLVLTDRRQLAISDTEAKALFASAAALFAEAGLALQYADSQCWLLQTAQWQDLQTCTPDAACGHNVEIWMPKGKEARNWRKLQNEVQMCWFDDPVNQARQAQGLPVINSLWLQRINTPALSDTALPSHPPRTLFAASSPSGGGLLPAQAMLAQTVLYADTLISPALASDWAAWLDAYAALDANWFAPLLANKAGWPLRLHLGHSQCMRHFDCSRLAHLAFWRRNGLRRLAPCPVAP